MLALIKKCANRILKILKDTDTDMMELFQGFLLLGMSFIMTIAGPNMYSFTPFNFIKKVVTEPQLALILFVLGFFQSATVIFGNVKQRGTASLIMAFAWIDFAYMVGVGDWKTFLFVIAVGGGSTSFWVARRRQIEWVQYRHFKGQMFELKTMGVLGIEETVTLTLLENYVEEAKQKIA